MASPARVMRPVRAVDRPIGEAPHIRVLRNVHHRSQERFRQARCTPRGRCRGRPTCRRGARAARVTDADSPSPLHRSRTVLVKTLASIRHVILLIAVVGEEDLFEVGLLGGDVHDVVKRSATVFKQRLSIFPVVREHVTRWFFDGRRRAHRAAVAKTAGVDRLSRRSSSTVRMRLRLAGWRNDLECDQVAVADDPDPVRDPLHLGQCVAGEEHRPARSPATSRIMVWNSRWIKRVETGTRFIHDQHLGPVHERLDQSRPSAGSPRRDRRPSSTGRRRVGRRVSATYDQSTPPTADWRSR